MTIHLGDYTKVRVRRSLRTTSVTAARRLRDGILHNPNFAVLLEQERANRNPNRSWSMTRPNVEAHSTEYVVGQRDEGLCWLLSLADDHLADDLDIGLARRFTSLEEAKIVAQRERASVFEIINDKTVPAKLEEAITW